MMCVSCVYYVDITKCNVLSVLFFSPSSSFVMCFYTVHNAKTTRAVCRPYPCW